MTLPVWCKFLVAILILVNFFRPTATLCPPSLLLLGFIASSSGRKDRTWPKSLNRCPRSVPLPFPPHFHCISEELELFGSFLVLFALLLKVHIEFTEGEDKIILEGPTKDIQMAHSQFEAMVMDLVSIELTMGSTPYLIRLHPNVARTKIYWLCRLCKHTPGFFTVLQKF